MGWFILGVVVGGCAAVFFMVLFSANQKVDAIESDYYKSRCIGITGKIKTIIGSFRRNEIAADDAMNQIENELKL